MCAAIETRLMYLYETNLPVVISRFGGNSNLAMLFISPFILYRIKTLMNVRSQATIVNTSIKCVKTSPGPIDVPATTSITWMRTTSRAWVSQPVCVTCLGKSACVHHVSG